MHPYALPFKVIGCAMVFVITVAALRGPLKQYLPRCTAATFGFCLKKG